MAFKGDTLLRGKTEAGQRTTIDKNTPSIDLTQIKKIQQDILQWDIFKDLGALDSKHLLLKCLHSIYQVRAKGLIGHG
jgi:predicted kinase